MVFYQLYVGRISVRDFLKALILPCIGGIVFLAWLLAHDMVGRYWLANYIFNLHIPDVYGGLVEKTKPEFYVVSALALCGCIYSLYRGNIYARIICLLWVFEALQRFFYFSLDRHYYYQLQIFNGMLAGTFAWEIIKKWRIAAYVLQYCRCPAVWSLETIVWKTG